MVEKGGFPALARRHNLDVLVWRAACPKLGQHPHSDQQLTALFCAVRYCGGPECYGSEA